MASLSKAITAVCIAKLVEARKLSYKAKIGVVLRDYFADNPPADPRARLITVGQLLSMSSGATRDPYASSVVQALPLTQTNFDLATAEMFSANLSYAPGQYYWYNNGNYTVLGLIIETITGQGYIPYCAKTVLKKLRIRAKAWALISSAGGWRISALDYAKFLAYFADGLLKSSPNQWPQIPTAGSARYSIGVNLRQRAGGYDFWHSGLLYSWPQPPGFGSHFMAIAEGVRYVVNFSPPPSNVDAGYQELQTTLFSAAVGRSRLKHPAFGRPEPLPK
jgi:CubicO group peptidase (beta-lactamase class C family)